MRARSKIAFISLSLTLTGCSDGLFPPQQLRPTASVAATPLPVNTPLASLADAGRTTLTGNIAIVANDLILEAADTLNRFRKPIQPSGSTYRLTDVPVGRQIRVQVQYRKNPHVILSARADIDAAQKDKETQLNITLESTIIDLIYDRAQALGQTTIISTPVQQLERDERIKPFVNAVFQVLQTIMATPLDNIRVTIPTAPELVKKIDEVLPQIENTLTGGTALPTPVSSATPAPLPVPSASATPLPEFVAIGLRIKPGNDIKIAKDTPVQLSVVEVDALNRERSAAPVWENGFSPIATISSSGLLTPVREGTTVLAARVGNLSQTVRVFVTDGTLKSLTLIPENSFTIDSGRIFEMGAKGTDSKGNEVLVTPSWSLDVPSVASIDANGVIRGLQLGSVRVTGTASSFSQTVTVNIESGSTRFVEILPKNPVVLKGKTQLFQVLHRDLNENFSLPLFSFSAGNTSLGTIGGASGIFTASQPGTTEIKVTDIANTGSNTNASTSVTVAEQVPYIAKVSPEIVVPGQSVTLTGENFSSTPASNTVDFNGVQGTISSATPTSITVTVPNNIVSGFVSITSEGKKGNSARYVVTPQLNSLTPSQAAAGATVTLQGAHFDASNPVFNIVFFGNFRAPIPSLVTNTRIQVVVPSGVSSASDVRVFVRGDVSSNTLSFASSNRLTWSEKKAAPTARAGLSAEILDNQIYVLGSDQSGITQILEAYNPSQDTWATRQSLPTNRTNLATAVVENRLYAIGGSSASTSVEAYDATANTWSTKALLSVGRSNLMAETYNGRIYALGGIGANNAGKTVEEYNPSTNTWALRSESPTNRFNAATAVVGSRIYVIGGGSPAETLVTAYDPDANSWTTNLSPLPFPRTQAAAVTINSKIYVVGGFDDFNRRTSTVFEFTPGGSGTWTTVDSLPLSRAAGAATTIGGDLFFVGGWPFDGSPVSTLYKGDL